MFCFFSFITIQSYFFRVLTKWYSIFVASSLEKDKHQAFLFCQDFNMVRQNFRFNRNKTCFAIKTSLKCTRINICVQQAEVRIFFKFLTAYEYILRPNSSGFRQKRPSDLYPSQHILNHPHKYVVKMQEEIKFIKVIAVKNVTFHDQKH